MSPLQSWGRYPRVPPRGQEERPLAWASDALPAPGPGGSLLPYGCGRSYGDSCLNVGGTLLPTRGLDRLRAFDPATGVLVAEAGVTFEEVLRLVVPQGWFLPVTPGTKFVTVGGAIANDVHGKNHAHMGSFGSHVRRLELVRSDGSRRVCSPTENAELFAATVGGLGLTGLVTWAEVQLLRVHNPFILQETVPLADLADFFRVDAESERDFAYTVAWVDVLARGRKLGRGLYYRGNHAAPQLDGLPVDRSHLTRPSGGGLSVPFDLPAATLNRLTVSAFNALYRWKGLRGPPERLVHYDPFFYPLDAVQRWNRAYGRHGLLQFQCVVPPAAGEAAIRELLERIGRAGQGSFLAVLKRFGTVPSVGMLSFARPGPMLALDFPHRGDKTLALLRELEWVAREAGGALYPAKDACMTPETFRASYPALPRFLPHVDPAFSSSFWRRVTRGAPTDLDLKALPSSGALPA